MTPDDFLKKLRQNKLYHQALKQADDMPTRRAVMAQSEQFLVGFTSALLPLLERVRNERNGLVTTEQQTSGSLDNDD